MRKSHLLLAVAAVLCYSLLEPFLLEVDETAVEGGIPAWLEGRRMAYVSDIHCGPYYSTEREAALVGMVNGLGADIIFLGGDYILMDRGMIGPCVRELGRLRAPLGVYAVLGNHDNWVGRDETLDALAEANITVLSNRGVRPGPGLWVGGVGDLWTEPADAEAALDGSAEADYRILLSHNPRIVEEGPAAADLILSGHTHGGQLLPVRLIAPYLPGRLRQKMVSGGYRAGNATVLVSDGVGTVFFPLRFLVKPEINVITLKRG
jgi:uncharacterized protein